MNIQRPTPGEILFALVALGLALVLHGPAGAILLGAMAQAGGANLLLVVLAGLLWLVSGIIIIAATLALAWLPIAAWRSRRR